MFWTSKNENYTRFKVLEKKVPGRPSIGPKLFFHIYEISNTHPRPCGIDSRYLNEYLYVVKKNWLFRTLLAPKFFLGVLHTQIEAPEWHLEKFWKIFKTKNAQNQKRKMFEKKKYFLMHWVKKNFWKFFKFFFEKARQKIVWKPRQTPGNLKIV